MYLFSNPLLLLILLLIGLVFFWTYLRNELYDYIDSDTANPTIAMGLRFVLMYADKLLTPAMFQRQQPQQPAMVCLFFFFYHI